MRINYITLISGLVFSYRPYTLSKMYRRLHSQILLYYQLSTICSVDIFVFDFRSWGWQKKNASSGIYNVGPCLAIAYENVYAYFAILYHH